MSQPSKGPLNCSFNKLCRGRETREEKGYPQQPATAEAVMSMGRGCFPSTYPKQERRAAATNKRE